MFPEAFQEMVRQIETRDGKKLEPEYVEYLRKSLKDLTPFELNVPKGFVLSTVAHAQEYSNVFPTDE